MQGLKSGLYRLFVGIFVCTTVFITYNFSPVVQRTDSIWVIPTSLSIIEEGNTDLDEYRNFIERSDYWFIDTIDDHIYSYFPIGVSILTIPFLYAVDKISIATNHGQLSYLFDVSPDYSYKIEVLIASLFVTLTVFLIYRIGRKFLNLRFSMILSFILAFCTSAWSTASRALWQHGPTMLMLTIALFLIILAEDNQKLIQYASIPLVFSYIIRPTNAISLVALTLFIFIQYRKYFLKFLLWGLFIIIPFVVYNYQIYHFILSPYYLPGRLGTNPDFFQALVGDIISPGRGLLVYTPVLLVSLMGVVIKIRQKEMRKLDFFLIGIILLHWIVISTFDPWTAGVSYGQRFFTDMLPYSIYFMIPFLHALAEKVDWQRIGFAVLILLTLTSFSIHFIGAAFITTFRDMENWNDCEFIHLQLNDHSRHNYPTPVLDHA